MIRYWMFYASHNILIMWTSCTKVNDMCYYRVHAKEIWVFFLKVWDETSPCQHHLYTVGILLLFATWTEAEYSSNCLSKDKTKIKTFQTFLYLHWVFGNQNTSQCLRDTFCFMLVSVIIYESYLKPCGIIIFVKWSGWRK